MDVSQRGDVLQPGPIDAGAWRGLEDLRDALRSFLARHCQDESELDDVIQETFLRAARYRSGARRVLCLKPWTMRIALNVLSDWRRRGRRFQAGPLGDEASELPAPEAAPLGLATYRLGRWWIDGECAHELIESTLGCLRVEDRALLGSFYGGACSSRVSALECGIPRHLVKIRLFRARRRLLRMLRRKMALEERWSALAS